LSADLRGRVLEEVDSLRDEITRMGDYIHANPELGYQERKAAERLTSELRRFGFEVEKGIHGMETAFRAELPGRGPGPKVALVAEYDALPPPIGHGCQHNLIAAMSVGAGMAMSGLMPELDGTLCVLGSPAEEGIVDGCGGKVLMIDEFRGMDAAMMIHPYDITTGGAPPTWNREGLEIEFQGAPANAGNAEDASRGVNALEACMLFWSAVNAYRPHIREGARVFGIITEGGTSPNIVPARAVTRLQIRVPTYPYFLEVVEKVKNCARGAALALGAQVKMRAYANRYLAFVPNHTLAAAYERNLRSLGVTAEEPYKMGGVTDMGNVSHACPSIQPYLATAPRGTTWHSSEAAGLAVSQMGHDAAIVGAKALCLTALDVFTGAVDVGKMRREFEEARAGLT